MQANQTSVVWTVIICSLVLLVAGFMMANSVKNTEVVMPDVPTAAEIASLISVPEAPAAPSADMLDKLCELTDGCEFYEWNEGDYNVNDDFWNFVNNEINYDSDAVVDAVVEDFHEAIGDLISLNWEGFGDVDTEFTIEGLGFDERDMQIRAYSEDDKNEGSWEFKVFAKVVYQDLDEEDEDKVYVLISTTLDEGDYDELSIEEVNRRFEFA